MQTLQTEDFKKLAYAAKVNESTFLKAKNGKMYVNVWQQFLLFPTQGPNGEQGSAGIPGPFGPRVSNEIQ